MAELPPVSWTLHGYPVRIDNWSATAAAPGGFDQMRGEMEAREYRGLPASGQGSIVTAWLPNGQAMWEGRLAAAPAIRSRRAILAAQGYKVQAEKKTDRLFIQSRDFSQWVAADADPHIDSNGNPVYDHYKRIQGETHHGRLMFKLDQSVALTAGGNNRAGFVFYAEGINLKTLAFVVNYDASDEEPNLELQVMGANGPIGSLGSADGTWAINTAHRGAEMTTTLSGTVDLAAVFLRIQADLTPTGQRRYSLNRCRLNSDITSSATYNAYQVASYIAGQFAWADQTTASTFNVLPFDWDQSNWAEALTYISELEDKYWRVLEDRGAGPRLFYESWGTTNWTILRSRGATIDLTPLELFNQVRVWYSTPTGVRRSVLAVANPDPLAGTGIVNTYEYELQDAQLDNVIPTAVAGKLLARYSVQRYSGRIDLDRALDAAGTSNPYQILPGDTVTISDFDQNTAVTLRIIDADYSYNHVTLGVEQPINLPALIAATHHHRRHHHRRRR